MLNKMVQFCCVVGCGNRSNREYMRFYRLPALKKRTDITSAKAELILKRRRQWLENIARVDLKDGDSNYSAGYIRVCSDHFITGEPSELTDVVHPDWAPTLKMGHGRIRMKGNLRKRIMLGFPLPEKRRNQKKNVEFGRRKEPNSLTMLVDDPDESEVEQRKMLAIETEYVERNKKYKPVKNPYAKRTKKPPPEIKMQQMQIRRQQIRTFMQRKKQIYVKQTTKKLLERTINEIKLEQPLENINHWFSAFMEKRPVTTVQNVSDTEHRCTSYVSPLIHKITKDAVVVQDGNVLQQLDTTSQSNLEIIPVDRCDDEPLNNNKMRIYYYTLHNSTEDELLDNSIKQEDNEDISLDNKIQTNDLENESLDNKIQTNDYENESLGNSSQSEDEVQIVYPSPDEERLLQELMNGHLQTVKEEIKQELDEV